MKKSAALISILAALVLTGCSSLLVKDSSLKKRTFDLSIGGGIFTIGTSTEDLVIGEVETKKKQAEGE